ncbi:MgtC/SapB family protein [Rubrobacter xylanophilus]|nr:MgtC/SapB family protein [Rubrobacter xylanophilus]
MEEIEISQLEVVARLLAAMVLCGLIGLERELRDQPAGFRTHILLGLGAALFTLVSAYGFKEFTELALEAGGGVQFDPTRIAAQIVTGIGFLGAGAILRQGLDVRGLTTAASLWAAAAVGTAAGAGYFFGAAATTAIVLAALYLLREFRAWVVARRGMEFGLLQVTLEEGEGDVSGVTETLQRYGGELRRLDAEVEEGAVHYTVQVRLPSEVPVQEMLAELSRLPGVRRAGISGLHPAE